MGVSRESYHGHRVINKGHAKRPPAGAAMTGVKPCHAAGGSLFLDSSHRAGPQSSEESHPCKEDLQRLLDVRARVAFTLQTSFVHVFIFSAANPAGESGQDRVRRRGLGATGQLEGGSR